MSYRLINSNEIAIKYPEVNDMPCIYVDLPNGLDNRYYDLSSGHKEKEMPWYLSIFNTELLKQKGHWIKKEDDTCCWYVCSECEQEPLKNRWNDDDVLSTFCPNCGAKMESEE